MSNARLLPNGDSETITVAKQYTEKDLEECGDGSVCVSREAVEREEKKVKSTLEKLTTPGSKYATTVPVKIILYIVRVSRGTKFNSW